MKNYKTIQSYQNENFGAEFKEYVNKLSDYRTID
jgi:hypothetical protein